MLAFSHNPWLVAASVAVALMAGFTGLSLLRGASALSHGQRKLVVVMASVALGGGIWSMHFVAMLGLQLPVPFYYDALITLMSALVAILMVGLALLILHFIPRSAATLTLSGAIVGAGIGVMHFIGMLGMEICQPVNGLRDYVISGLAAIVLSVVAIWVAYGARTRRNIFLGTVCFAMAVVAVHYIAVHLTGFRLAETAAPAGTVISNATLALGVTVAIFLICGAFLLTGVTFLTPANAPASANAPAFAPASASANAPAFAPAAAAAPDPAPASASAPASPAMPGPAPQSPQSPQTGRPAALLGTAATDPASPAAPLSAGVPYVRDGRTQFAPRDSIAALRAEGHYSLLYVGGEKLFCPWSLTEAESRLAVSGFVRTHRSYLVNPAHVSSFERQKDTGMLWFDGVASLPKVPVSRSRMTQVREALGL